MNDKERRLTLIQEVQTDEQTEKKAKNLRQTNPIAKKLLEFHHKDMKKFNVKDLFKP